MITVVPVEKLNPASRDIYTVTIAKLILKLLIEIMRL
jgi:hypothetical protein